MVPTIVRPEKPRSNTRTGSSLSFPRELVAVARARAERLAFATTALVGTLGCGWLLLALAGLVRFRTDGVVPLAALAGAALSGILLAACRSPRLPDGAVVYCALGYVVLVCGLAGLAHALHEFASYGHVTAFGPYSLAIATFPLLLPCPPRITAITSILSATAVSLGFVAAERIASLPISTRTWLDMNSVLLGCCALSYVQSRMLYRLQSDLARAQRLGSYVLEAKLGQGGMGEVWSARHHLLARRAAIKLIQPRHLDGPEARREAVERFTREAQATAALTSPHTVRLYDFGVTDEQTFYYAMELLDGINLSELVRRFGPQPPERVRSILLQVCDSLAEAHDKGLIHRDIKPGNLMLCRQGRSRDYVKVLDFGIVALLPELQRPASEPSSERLTEAGAIVGTPAYMAPELLMEQRGDQRSDLYSLGCVAYWLLAGRAVFEAASHWQVAAAQLHDRVAPPSKWAPVPAALDEIVLACLAKEPEGRPGSADDLAARLRACALPAEWDDRRADDWWRDRMDKGPRAIEAGATEDAGTVAAAGGRPGEPATVEERGQRGA